MCRGVRQIFIKNDSGSSNAPEIQRSWYKSDSSMSVTQEEFRSAMGCFATGVTVITVDDHGKVEGMTANAFTSVSLDPILVLVCVSHQARTHAHLHARKRFGINVLSEHQRKISEHYALAERDPALAEHEAGAKFDRTQHGTPVLTRGAGLPGMPVANNVRSRRPHHLHCRGGRRGGARRQASSLFSRRVSRDRARAEVGPDNLTRGLSVAFLCGPLCSLWLKILKPSPQRAQWSTEEKHRGTNPHSSTPSSAFSVFHFEAARRNSTMIGCGLPGFDESCG